MEAQQTYCSVCGTPVWWSETAQNWFHDTWPRYLSTRALSVTQKNSLVIDYPQSV